MPADWLPSTIGDLAMQRSEKVLPHRGDRTPYVALEHIPNGGGRLLGNDTAGSAASHKTRFREGDTLFGKLRPNLRKVVRARFDGVCSTDIIAIGAKPGTDEAFLYQLLASDVVYRHVMGDITGTKMPRTSWERLADLGLRVPLLPEQRAIAAILDAIDDAIERTEAVIAATEELRRALLHDLLTRGVPGWHSEWKEVPGLGTVPACWKVGTLVDCLCEMPTNGIYKEEAAYGAGTYLVRIDDFDLGQMRRLNGFNRVRATEDEVERYGLNAGDIVLNRVNSLELVGKAVLFPEIGERAMFESNMMRIRTTDGVEPEFVALELVSPRARSYFTSRAKKAVQQASVNQQDVVQFPLPLPDGAEQAEIARIDQALLERIRAERERVADLRSLKSSAADALLTGSIRVSIGVLA